MSITIYGLTDPRTGLCRYVGKTSRVLAKRLRQHVARSSAEPGAHKCASWIASLVAAGLKPEIFEIEQVDVEQWQEAEQYWIACLRWLGCDLTNMTSGGGGENRTRHSDEIRRKISVAAKAQFSDPRAREKAAEYARAAWLDPAYVARAAESRKVFSADPEFIRKQREVRTALWATPEYREKVTLAQQGRHSEGAKSMWQRPEYREAQRLARQKRYGESK